MLKTETIKYDDLKFAIARAKQLDPKLKTRMQRKLRTDLRPMADRIADAVPKTGPLSKMTPRWGQAQAKVTTAPGARAGRAIVMIAVSGPGFARLLSITERAGSRTDGYTPSGKAMIKGPSGKGLQDRYPLVGRGGRFIWKAFLKELPELNDISVEIVNDFVEEVNDMSWGR